MNSRLVRLFDEARRIESAEDRNAFLAEACEGDADLREQVERMLADEGGAKAFFDESAAAVTSIDVAEIESRQPTAEALPKSAASRLVASARSTPASTRAARGAEQAGDRFGPYKLLQVIGEGGFGTVWMAEQSEPVTRRVALKVIKQGMDTKEVLARFEVERKALALMDHPNIATVLDADSAESGRPYFVMELLKGVPITQFCGERKLGIPERLEIFGEVCAAVNHAHQKGIIHRDLKPSNILVTLHGDKGVPKIIDFGIAKATQNKLTEATLFHGILPSCLLQDEPPLIRMPLG